MIKIPHEFTLGAIHEKQFQIAYRCKLQHLKLLKNRVCEAQQEYIDIRNKVME